MPSRPHLSDTPLLLPPGIEFSVLNWDSAQKNKVTKKDAEGSAERDEKKKIGEGEVDTSRPMVAAEETGHLSKSERRKRREEEGVEGGKRDDKTSLTRDELRRNSVYSGLSITASYHTSPYSTSDSETDTDTEWCYKDTDIGRSRKTERNVTSGFRSPATNIFRDSNLRNDMEGMEDGGDDDDVGGEMDDGEEEEEEEEEELIEVSMDMSTDQDRNLDREIPSGGRYRDGWEEREERERESTITALDLQQLQLDVKEGEDLEDSPSPTPWTSSRVPSTCTSALASPVLLGTSHRSPVSPAAYDLAITDTYDSAPPLPLSFTLSELPFPNAAPSHDPLSSFAAINPLNFTPPNGPSPANTSLATLPPTPPLSSTATQPTDSRVGSSSPCPEGINDITVDSCDFNELADESNINNTNKLILDISIISDFYSYDNENVNGSDHEVENEDKAIIINNVNNEYNTRINNEDEEKNQLNKNTNSRINIEESGPSSTSTFLSCEEREEDGMADCLIMLQRCLKVLKKR